MPTGVKKSADNPRRAKARQLVDEYNDWVRTSNSFDAVVDFEKATADPKTLRRCRL